MKIRNRNEKNTTLINLEFLKDNDLSLDGIGFICACISKHDGLYEGTMRDELSECIKNGYAAKMFESPEDLRYVVWDIKEEVEELKNEYKEKLEAKNT
jgi:hypothetical protein